MRGGVSRVKPSGVVEVREGEDSELIVAGSRVLEKNLI